MAADRGIRRARFEVLCTAPCPAALVECGFLSNRQEEEQLLTKDYRDAMAEGIAKGILSYIQTVSNTPSDDSPDKTEQ
jgi:N-acetylmuramoyl-L-alanine amidase